ncbi:MAG: hypothetical protein KAS01_01485 [Candidatus Pacebacteria bacterium]|nr:hypothetical protein [Candidatus Paceibacterota bacterium]
MRIKGRKTRRKTNRQIEEKIVELEKIIDKYRTYDLRNPAIQNAIIYCRNRIWGLMFSIGKEKEYNGKKYYAQWF